MPFAWAGVSVYAAGASALRVRLSAQSGDGLSVAAVDGAGVPVVSVRSLVLRPVPAGALAAGGGVRDALFAEQWALVAVAGDVVAGRWVVAGAGAARLAAGLAAAGVEVRAYPDLAGLAAAVGAGEPVPEVVLACAGGGWDGPAGGGPGYGGGDAAGAAGRVLGLVQQWLAADELTSSRLVVLTRGAVACGPGQGVADLAGAAVWGLVRSAQSENPGRLVLADLPAAGSVGPAALRVLAAARTQEPELAIRAEGVYARRLGRPAGGLEPPGDGRPWRLGTVLVTGGTGTLGGLVAGHLAGTGRARAVVLASRSGPAAAGVAALAAGLAARGARVQVVACDVADRAAAGRAAGPGARGQPADRGGACRRGAR